MNWMIFSRFLILWFIMYIATNLFGLSFINPHDLFGISLTGTGRWIYNEILGTIVSWLFAIFWSMKSASDMMYNNKVRKYV